MKTNFSLTLLGILIFTNVFAQKTNLDSLWEGKTIHDTVKIKDVLNYGIEIQSHSMDTALFYYRWVIDLVDKITSENTFTNQESEVLTLHKATALCNIGRIQCNQGHFDVAIEFCLNSIHLFEQLAVSPNAKIVLASKKGMSDSYNNFGIIQRNLGRYDRALEYYLKSFSISQELSHSSDSTIATAGKTGMSRSYNNIGFAYSVQGNYSEALEYYYRSLKIDEELSDLRGMSIRFNNIGLAYKEQGKYKRALEYYQKSLRIKEELNEVLGLTLLHERIASLHIALADSLPGIESDGRKQHYKQALEYGYKSFELAKEIGSLPSQNLASKTLMATCKKLNDSDKALEFAEIFIATRDSMFRDEKTKAISDIHTKYETEKKQQEIEKQQLIIEKQLIDNKKKRNQRNFFITGTLLLTLSVILILRGYQQKKRSNSIITEKSLQLEQANEELKTTLDVLEAKNTMMQKQHKEIESQRNDLANLAWELQEKSEEVEKQKNILSAQNKDITDSIVYAQRIQSAVLPSHNLLSQLFTDYFIIYKPKSIVSGDFYWATKIREHIIFCVTDCTGHGVPGAFMSMMGVSFLNEIVRKEEITNAAQVLNDLRDHVVNSMEEEESSYVQLDGMDIGLCVLNTRTLMLQYAGANIPCWIASTMPDINEISTKAERINGLIELKPDRMPIARYEWMMEFTHIDLQLKKGDIIYMSSDGYSDQFGGIDEKKFQKNKLIELLITNKEKPFTEQKDLIGKVFEEWKGNRPQLDDVTLLGVKV